MESFELRPEGLTWREIDGEVVVLDLDESNYLGLNATGSALWRLLQGGATEEELVAGLLQEFEASNDNARADVRSFLDTCLEQGLIQRQDAGKTDP
ncbi:MAG: PqqD family protein [Solirubrobacteraceae bacterium]